MRLFPRFIVVIVLAVSCQSAPSRTDRGNVEVVNSIFDAFNDHDWSRMLRYYSEHAVFKDPSFDVPVSDLKKIAAHYQRMQEYFPDIRNDVVSITWGSDRLLVEFVSSGTSINGETLRLPICTVFTFAN